MQFYNGLVSPLIIEPLRYFFSTNTAGSNMIWDPDEKKRTVDISESYDFHKVALQEKPRILVTRGGYVINKVGITDNLAEAPNFSETGGLKNQINMLMYSGNATITIEAKTKGTCELLTDMVSHFVSWTRPVICDAMGWKEFGLPMAISDVAMMMDEDPGVPKFQSNISIPWACEEHWNVKNSGIVLKNIVSNISPLY